LTVDTAEILLTTFAIPAQSSTLKYKFHCSLLLPSCNATVFVSMETKDSHAFLRLIRQTSSHTNNCCRDQSLQNTMLRFAQCYKPESNTVNGSLCLLECDAVILHKLVRSHLTFLKFHVSPCVRCLLRHSVHFIRLNGDTSHKQAIGEDTAVSISNVIRSLF
jgi:hypothetical protein